MGAKKRILHVLYSHVFGGAENVACQIIGLFRDDPDVEQFYTSPDGSVRPSLEERGIRYYPLERFTPAELRRVIREVQPTMLHTHDMRACFLAALVCRDIPYLSHIHNNNFDSRGITPKAVLYRLAAGRAKKIFWVSRAAFEGYRFHEALRSKSTVLPNVVDPALIREKAEQAAQEDWYDIVFLGRLTYPKNPARLVEVMAGAAKAQPGVKCAIVGIGELEQEVRDAIARFDCADSVKLLGFRSNPYGLLKHAKLMLMTSLWEGLPMCALEAMALGTPIVSTPVDGLLDVVDSGINGFLEADTSALIDRCAELCREPALRERFSQASREKAEKLLDVENYKREIWQAYCLADREDT